MKEKLNLAQNSKFKIVLFFLLYFITIIVEYKIGKPVSFLFYYALLAIFLLSDKYDVLFVAFVLALSSKVGALFHPSDPIHNLEIFYVGAFDRGIHFNEFFIIVALFKTYKQIFSKKTRIHLFYGKSVFLLFVFFYLFSWLLAFFFGISTSKVLRVIRLSLPWTLVFIYPVLFTPEKLKQLFHYLYFFVFLIVIVQFYELAVHHLLLTDLGGSLERTGNLQEEITDESNPRQIYGAFINIICIISSFYYYFINDTYFKKSFLITVICASLLSIFISATRGYILAAGFIFVFAFLLNLNRSSLKRIIQIFILGIFAFAMLFTNPSIKKQVFNSLDRLNTLNAFAEGDLTAGGSLKRLTERAPRVMEKFRESPIIGYGFSNDFFSGYDPHVGHPSQLLNVGILGYIAFWYSYLFVLFKIFNLRNKKKSIIVKHISNLFILGFLSFMLIHSSSNQMFFFLIGYAENSIILMLYISVVYIWTKQHFS